MTSAIPNERPSSWSAITYALLNIPPRPTCLRNPYFDRRGSSHAFSIPPSPRPSYPRSPPLTRRGQPHCAFHLQGAATIPPALPIRLPSRPSTTRSPRKDRRDFLLRPLLMRNPLIGRRRDHINRVQPQTSRPCAHIPCGTPRPTGADSFAETRLGAPSMIRPSLLPGAIDDAPTRSTAPL